MTICCTQRRALLEQAAQQMRLSRARIALHQQARRQQFLEIESGPVAAGAVPMSMVAVMSFFRINPLSNRLAAHCCLLAAKPTGNERAELIAIKAAGAQKVHGCGFTREDQP